MDLVQLRYFLKVVEARSFTRAAEALHIAQPAVTRQIRLLEEELGASLLHRHSKGAEPTEAGLRLESGARAMMQLAAEIRAQVMASASEVTGTLRIGCPPSVATTLFGSAVATFHELHPAVQLHLEDGYSEVLRDAILGDRLDCAIVTPQVANPLLQLIPIYSERLWMFFSPQRGKRFSNADLDLKTVAQHQLIQPSRRNTVRLLLEEHARNEHFDLSFGLTSESLPLIKTLVKAGHGTHVSPYTAFSADVARKELDGRPIRGLAVIRCLALRADHARTLAQSAFLEIIKQEAVALSESSSGMVKLF